MACVSESQTGSTLLTLLRNPSDPEAWYVFVGRYGPKIEEWCRRRGLQDADAKDVVSDVLLKLARTMRTFVYDPAKGSFRSWLRTVTANALADFVAARERVGVGSGTDAVSALLRNVEAREDFERNLQTEYDLELLDQAKKLVQLRVTRAAWQAFLLHAVEGRTAAAVAKELGMTAAAVYMAKSRVQRKLKKEIERLERDGST
jgi:RNA polymerase sigma factor (sigma-70 family)